MFCLFLNSSLASFSFPCNQKREGRARTLVTFVPARKNTINNVNGRLHGCTACAIAVKTAATMPAGVRDLWEWARYTIASVMGTAMIAFILEIVYLIEMLLFGKN